MNKGEKEKFSVSYIIVFGIVFILMLVTLHHSLAAKDESRYVKVEIENGDTLWEIAEKYSEQHSYTTKGFIDWVEKNNTINGNHIISGETLVIPVKKDTIRNNGNVLLANDDS